MHPSPSLPPGLHPLSLWCRITTREPVPFPATDHGCRFMQSPHQSGHRTGAGPHRPLAALVVTLTPLIPRLMCVVQARLWAAQFHASLLAPARLPPRGALAGLSHCSPGDLLCPEARALWRKMCSHCPCPLMSPSSFLSVLFFFFLLTCLMS